MISIHHVEDILKRMRRTKIAVYGDFCLDAYWRLDPRGSEVSIETGLPAQAVARHRYALGGAGNIVANLAALQPAEIHAIGTLGDDIFGKEMLRQLQTLGADTAGIAVQEKKFDTVTYCKRYLEGEEQPRIDFGFFNRRSAETDAHLLHSVRQALEHADALIVNQQVPGSIPHEAFFKEINALFAKFADKIILLDSRHYGQKFHGIYRKVNAVEAAQLNGVQRAPGDPVARDEALAFAKALFERDRKPVFLTRGSHGLVVCDATGVHEVPGIQFMAKLDPVGAGDTTVSALTCSLAAGASPVQAAELANFAAAVTVQKLYQTGTASPAEIMEIAADPDYLYQPELAEDARRAVFFQKSEIEICCDLPSLRLGEIRHAVFDHDGTISTLRQGWEAVMEPMMLRAILGDQFESADEALYQKVRQRVRDYIDQSTGIQTILQMEALLQMVREFGIVPAEKIRDKFAYKALFNQALMDIVHRRIEKFERGELDVADFTVKGAAPFLQALRERGITLYLASGTDRDDVVAEAQALGYADLFDGGIYGAVGDVQKYSKKMVIEKILDDHDLQGPELATFGDGPVEIRECRKHGGIAVGIASDEIRRYGLNPEKRARLIKAGAHFVVPDFSQAHRLIELLFCS